MTESRIYQPIAAAWLAERKRGMIVSPARSGKTIIMAMALAKAIQSRQMARAVRVGWMANTLEQCQQARRAIGFFPAVHSQDVKIECAAAQTDWSDRDVLVVDECHRSLAPTHAAQIATCHGRVWGMTATPNEDSDERAALLAMFGDLHVVTADHVRAHTAPAIVQWLDATDNDIEALITAEIDKEVARRRRWWKGDPGQLWGQVAFQVCARRGVVENQARNAAAIAAANSPRSTVVLVGQVEHAETLAGRLSSARAVYAAMGAKSRRETLAQFNAGELRCIVGTTLVDEGIDLPRAEVLVLVAGGRSNSRTTQRTARVLTKFAGKEHGLIYDFTDHYHPLPAKHSRLRGELYVRLGYQQRAIIT